MGDHSTIVNGRKAEAIVLADLVKRGYHVSLPFSGHCPYDLIFADDWHRLCRLQVKYRTAKNGRIGQVISPSPFGRLRAGSRAG